MNHTEETWERVNSLSKYLKMGTQKVLIEIKEIFQKIWVEVAS